jgi:hypothetical protein
MAKAIFRVLPLPDQGRGRAKKYQKKVANHIGLVEIDANPYYIDRHLIDDAN